MSTTMTSLMTILLMLSGTSLAINTVTELKTEKYLGRWYQMYASPLVDIWFELGAVCVTADYAVNPNGTVSVTNMERVDQPNGTLKVKLGYAQPTNVTGKLEVHLQNVPFNAPYWVVKLGNETFGDKGLYQYSVVTDAGLASLFVLARDVDDFRKNYQGEVLAFLEEAGFTKPYNLPLETLQSPDCQYGPVPPPVQKTPLLKKKSRG